MRSVRRLGRLALLPALAFVALLAWMFAAPLGSAWDDGYHLASTWCGGAAEDYCQPGASVDGRMIPAPLVHVDCHLEQPAKSAACLEDAWALDGEWVEYRGGNFATGSYPPIFYSVMSVFVGDDVQVSVLVQRTVTIVLFLGLVTSIAALSATRVRRAFIWTWMLTAVPFGLFLLTTNNPSAWGTIGVVAALFALLSWYEAESRGRRIALGVVYAVAMLMAAGTRGDTAIYAGLATAIAMLLTVDWSRAWWLRSILPIAMGLVALAFFLTSRQSDHAVLGFTGGGEYAASQEYQLSGVALLAYNLLNVPILWAGAFGMAGFDNRLPWAVPLGSVAVAVFVGVIGLGRKVWRQLIAIGIVGVVLWILPVWILQAGGDQVGSQVQPRYLVPLVALLIGLVMLAPRGRAVVLTRFQTWLVVGAFIVIHAVALHWQLRRYVTGVDVMGFNLDAGAEWWWPGLPFGPMAVWLVGTAAFTTLVVLLVPRLAGEREFGDSRRLVVR